MTEEKILDAEFFREAGRKGAEVVRKKYGKEHYSKMGKKRWKKKRKLKTEH